MNLATVNQQYLHDDRAALNSYHAYLNLNPRPANWDDVNAIVATLEKPETKIAGTAPPVEHANPAPPEYRPVPRPAPVTVATRPSYPVQQPEPAVKYTQHYPPATRTSPPIDESYPGGSVPAETVRVPPEPVIVTTPPSNPVATTTTVMNPAATNQPAEVLSEEVPPPPKKTGFWHSLFGGSPRQSDANAKYMGTGLTPVPPGGDTGAGPATKTSELPEAKPGGFRPGGTRPGFRPVQLFFPAQTRARRSFARFARRRRFYQGPPL